MRRLLASFAVPFLALSTVLACSGEDAAAPPAATGPNEDSGPSTGPDAAPPDGKGDRDGGTTDSGAKDGSTKDGSMPVVPIALPSTLVRSSGWPFAIGGGTLYRLDMATHLLYAGDVDDPASDHVLADVGDQGSVKPNMLVTTTHVVLSNSGKITRVARADGALDVIPYNGTNVADYLVHDGSGGLLGFGSLSVTKLTILRRETSANAWTPYFTNNHVNGVQNDVVDTLAFTFDSGKILGVDEYAGPYLGDPTTQGFTFLDAASWTTLHMDPPSYTPGYEVVANGTKLHVLKRLSCPTSSSAPSRIGTWDTTNAVAATAIDVPPNARSLVAGPTELYTQSYCSGDTSGIVRRDNPATGVVAIHERLRTHPMTIDPKTDVYDWQLRWPLAADGAFVYFLEGETLQRTPRL